MRKNYSIMQSGKAIIYLFLSQALSAHVFALRLNADGVPAPTQDTELNLAGSTQDTELNLVNASLEPGEVVIVIQPHGTDSANVKKTIEGFRALHDVEDEPVTQDNRYFIQGPDYVKIPFWARLGNSLHQLFHAIAYAEAKGIPKVMMPKTKKRGHIQYLFDLPNVLQIKPVSETAKAAECKYDKTYYYQTCSMGYKKEDIRRALLTYVKPYLKPEIDKVCQSKDQASNDLVIHLRGGDLTHMWWGSIHPQGRMPPCSFYRHLIETEHFSSVTIVAQDGEKDKYCRKSLLTAFNGSTVLVKETDHSFFDDMCTLMTSQYAAFGLTTFAESLTMMNENLKKVYVPSLKYNGGDDIEYGSSQDLAGEMECEGKFDKCAKGVIQYELYDIPGLEKLLLGEDKKHYILEEEATYTRTKTCGQCVL